MLDANPPSLASLPHAVLVAIAQHFCSHGCAALRASCRALRAAHDEAVAHMTLVGRSALAAAPALLPHLPHMHQLSATCVLKAPLSPLTSLTQLRSLDVSPWPAAAWHRHLAPSGVESLSALTGLTSLKVDARQADPSTNWLAPLTALQSLTLTGRQPPSQMLGSAALPSLTTLSLDTSDSYASQPTSNWCARLTGLSPLTIASNSLSSVGGFPTSLQSLDIHRCYHITNVEPLSTLSHLESLKLAGTVQQLPPLPSLTHLSANSYAQEQVPAHLPSSFPQLQLLDLHSVHSSCDLSPIAGLQHLTHLTLDIKDLQMDGRQLSAAMARLCASLPQLQSLWLSATLDVVERFNLDSDGGMVPGGPCLDLSCMAALSCLSSLFVEACWGVGGLDAWHGSHLASSLQSLNIHADVAQAARRGSITEHTGVSGGAAAGSCSEDPAAAVGSVIGALRGLTSLQLSAQQPVMPHCLPHLSHLTRLQSLRLKVLGKSKEADTSAGTSSQAAGVQQAGRPVAPQPTLDLTPLTPLTQLVRLSLCSLAVDIAPLTVLKGLTRLILDCPDPAALAPLPTITQLQSLELQQCEPYVAASLLAPLHNLRSLAIYHEFQAGRPQAQQEQAVLQELGSEVPSLVHLTALTFTLSPAMLTVQLPHNLWVSCPQLAWMETGPLQYTYRPSDV